MSATSRNHGPSESSVHHPVMLREVMRFLDLHPGLTVVDGTVGAGGHSREILKTIGSEGILIGLDRDPMMLKFASQTLMASNCHLRQSNYAALPEILRELGLEHADRVLLDLGMSSDQLADDQRGFGFESQGPLDLRFDPSSGEPAWQLIDHLREAELTEIFKQNGEERFSERIARKIVELRKSSPVQSAADLIEAVRAAIPRKYQKRAKKHPATRIFQALRIAVNDELSHLDNALNDSISRSLVSGGRAVVISFHSLEDRLVKRAFRNSELWESLTPKPVSATGTEKRMNPRCRTAKLRAARKN